MSLTQQRALGGHQQRRSGVTWLRNPKRKAPLIRRSRLARANFRSAWLIVARDFKDFDPTGGTIRIERSLEQTKAGLRFKAPKTKNGRRTVALPASIVADLRAHLLRQQERRLSFGLGRAAG